MAWGNKFFRSFGISRAPRSHKPRCRVKTTPPVSPLPPIHTHPRYFQSGYHHTIAFNKVQEWVFVEFTTVSKKGEQKISIGLGTLYHPQVVVEWHGMTKRRWFYLEPLAAYVQLPLTQDSCEPVTFLEWFECYTCSHSFLVTWSLIASLLK